MFNRFSKSGRFINNSEQNQEFLRQKNLSSLIQYPTFDFKDLKQIENLGLKFVLHTVQHNEKMFQISNRYYSSPEYGWLICYTNKLPNELVLEQDMTLRIYYPLNNLLRLF